ncbi:hypothetical protein AC1031_006453 [Aphanomyces cochlioides]|nr:hypothetical protein AC1031_006453 [Aphanomyces cochlioides]
MQPASKARATAFVVLATSMSIASASTDMEYVLLGAYGVVMVLIVACGLYNLLHYHRPSAPSMSILPGIHAATDLWTEERLGDLWTCGICAFANVGIHGTCLLCGCGRDDECIGLGNHQVDAVRHRHDWIRQEDGSFRTMSLPQLQCDFAFVGQIAPSSRQATGVMTCLPLHTTLLSPSPALSSPIDRGEEMNMATKPFPLKHQWWLEQLASIKDAMKNKITHIRTSRRDPEAMVRRMCRRLAAMTAEELHAPLNIRFEGEPGVDAGGLEREWYMVISLALFHPCHGFFAETDATLKSLRVHPRADPTLCRGIGRFLGRALYDGHAIPARLDHIFFKLVLGIPISLNDLGYVHADLHRGLTWILTHDHVETLGLDFSVMEPPDEIIDLIPQGRNVLVTDANKKEYVALYLQWICVNRVSAPLAALVCGVHDVLSPSLLSVFDHKEMELLLCGKQEIDVEDWKQFTYVVASKSAIKPHVIAKWFWSILRTLAPSRRAILLQFVTGSSCVPLQGFQALTNRDGQICHFTLRIVSREETIYPVAHTCSNRLDLPDYPNKEMLENALLLAYNMDGTKPLGSIEPQDSMANFVDDIQSNNRQGSHTDLVHLNDTTMPLEDNVEQDIPDQDDEIDYQVSFNETIIGLTLEADIMPHFHQTIRVKDTTGPAASGGVIQRGDVLLSVNDQLILPNVPFAQVMHRLKSAPRPLVLRFRRAVQVELPAGFALDRRSTAASDLQSQLAVESDNSDDDAVASADSTHDSSAMSTRHKLQDAAPPAPPQSSLLSTWKTMDWGFLRKPSTPMEDIQTAMLSLRIQAPEAQLAPSCPQDKFDGQLVLELEPIN